MQLPEDDREREEEGLEAPAKLVSALKRSASAPIFIPPALDERVLRSARRHFAAPVKQRPKWSLLAPWGIAVAALVVALAVAPNPPWKARPHPGSRLVQRNLNSDGQVDILEAFALARELKSGAQPGRQWDVNRDGVVDQRDVAALAARAVSLGKGGGL